MKFLYVWVRCRLFLCVISAVWVGAAQAQAGDNTLLLRQAGVYVEAERYKDAVAILRTVEPRSREEELDVGLLTGKIYLAVDRPAKALEFFEDAEAQSLESFDATIGLANANLRLGQFKQARRLVQTARKLNPDSSEPDLILAAVALRTGNPTEAKAQMQALFTQRPDSEGVAVAYAKYLVLTGDNTAAKRSAERFMDRYASAASVRDYLADLEFKTGNVSAALSFKSMALPFMRSRETLSGAMWPTRGLRLMAARLVFRLWCRCRPRRPRPLLQGRRKRQRSRAGPPSRRLPSYPSVTLSRRCNASPSPLA